MGCKTELKQLLCSGQCYLLFTARKTGKQQTSKVLSTKSNEQSPLWKKTNPSTPVLSFLFVLQRLGSEKFHFRRKTQRFVALEQSTCKMISLQDFPLVVTVTVGRDTKILPLPDQSHYMHERASLTGSKQHLQKVFENQQKLQIERINK